MLDVAPDARSNSKTRNNNSAHSSRPVYPNVALPMPTVQLFGKSLLVPEPEKSVRYSWGTMVTPVLSRYILTLSEFRTSLKFIFENIAADMPLARPPVLRRPLSHFSHHIHSLCDAGRVFHTPTSPRCRFTSFDPSAHRRGAGSRRSIVCHRCLTCCCAAASVVLSISLSQFPSASAEPGDYSIR